jgi:TPR repeat protein
LKIFNGFLLKNILYLLLLVILFFSSIIFAQDSTESLAFKNKRPKQKAPYFYRPDLAYQIWQKFKLTQEANAGDPLAQHELGLRYLLGEGMPADTSQAVYWLKKAADQNLTSAKYNYAILLINGIGVPWNPFAAFKLFQSAANDGMVQAQYVVGILYTDNLTVRRDFNLAYYWIKKAAENDYEPAKEIIVKLEPRTSKTIVDSLLNTSGTPEEKNPIPNSSENLTNSLGLVFIDFETLSDSATTITDSMLVEDINYIGADSLSKILLADKPTKLNQLANKKNIDILSTLADNGCPEAQTILGRMYEKGIYLNRNLIDAAVYYYRALRNDSPLGTNLLWKLSRETDLLESVRKQSEAGNNIAKFVWYGLTSINFDNRIVISDALHLLDESANAFYMPAMVESGLNYYANRFGRNNVEKGLNIWKTAAQLGSNEAEIRITASRILDSFGDYNKSEDFKKIKNAAETGSLFAMVTVGLCYEKGLGTSQSKPKAVNYLRLAAQRGSRFAYEELKRIYDTQRPGDPEFLLSN